MSSARPFGKPSVSGSATRVPSATGRKLPSGCRIQVVGPRNPSRPGAVPSISDPLSTAVNAWYSKSTLAPPPTPTKAWVESGPWRRLDHPVADRSARYWLFMPPPLVPGRVVPTRSQRKESPSADTDGVEMAIPEYPAEASDFEVWTPMPPNGIRPFVSAGVTSSYARQSGRLAEGPVRKASLGQAAATAEEALLPRRATKARRVVTPTIRPAVPTWARMRFNMWVTLLL